MPEHILKRLRKWGLVVVPAFLVAAVITLGVRYVLKAPVTPWAAKVNQEESGDLSQAERILQEKQRSARRLFLDSILSIVQSYYVDEDRVLSRHLLDQALRALTEDKSFKLESRGDVSVLRYQGREITINTAYPYTYKKLLDDGLRISALLGNGPGKNKHDDRIWHDEGVFRFLNAMLGSLDPHSNLLDTMSYNELKQGTEGSFGGLGVVVGIRNNILTVIKPLPDSPAVRAGIRKHDRILKINNQVTWGHTLDSLVEYMRGAPGTQVNISLLRDGAQSPKEMLLRREIIRINSVESQLVSTEGTHVLHLLIESFSSRTAQEVKEVIRTAEKKTGKLLAGVIIDLRSNPGGLLDQAVRVSDLFLREGNIVSTRGRKVEVEKAVDGYTEYRHPLVVLINEDSASASEILAGALKDNDRAVVIGRPSFGKGSVQTIFELPGSQALKLTIARYYTPSGISIQNTGIHPNIWLQPVYKKSKNLNLLGRTRFQGERYLPNHLGAGRHGGRLSEGASLAARIMPSLDDGLLYGYYLMDKDKEGAEIEVNEDHELGIAVELFHSLRKHYGLPYPDGTRRAGHWMALLLDEVRQRTAAMNQQTAAWLHDNHGIDWSAGDDGPGRVLRKSWLRIDLEGEETLKVQGGKAVSVPWVVTNPLDRPVHHVSLYVSSPYTGLEPYEHLIGRIDGNEIRRGTLQFPVRPGEGEEDIALTVGLSVESKPTGEFKKTWLRVINQRAWSISSSISLVEEKGGRIAGRLEANESASVKIRLTNDGKEPSKGLIANLVNLAGSQISVSKERIPVSDLEPGQSSDIEINIRGGEKMVSSELLLGLELTSTELYTPLRHNLTLGSSPGGGRVAGEVDHSGKDNRLSH